MSVVVNGQNLLSATAWERPTTQQSTRLNATSAPFMLPISIIEYVFVTSLNMPPRRRQGREVRCPRGVATEIIRSLVDFYEDEHGNEYSPYNEETERDGSRGKG